MKQPVTSVSMIPGVDGGIEGRKPLVTFKRRITVAPGPIPQLRIKKMN